MAPSTPPPWRDWLAALTMASTFNVVMSAWRIWMRVARALGWSCSTDAQRCRLVGSRGIRACGSCRNRAHSGQRLGVAQQIVAADFTQSPPPTGLR